MSDQKYISPKEYAVIMGVTAQAVRMWIKKGHIKAIQIGGKNGRWFIQKG